MQYTNEWIEEGLVKGRQEGLATGREEGLREGLSLLLQRLYGERAADSIRRLSTCDLNSLRSLHEQLTAGTELDQLRF